MLVSAPLSPRSAAAKTQSLQGFSSFFISSVLSSSQSNRASYTSHGVYSSSNASLAIFAGTSANFGTRCGIDLQLASLQVTELPVVRRFVVKGGRPESSRSLGSRTGRHSEYDSLRRTNGGSSPVSFLSPSVPSHFSFRFVSYLRADALCTTLLITWMFCS